jgi:hypothetical protein
MRDSFTVSAPQAQDDVVVAGAKVSRRAFPTVAEELGRAMYDRFPELVTWLKDVVHMPMTRIPLPADPYKDPGRVPCGYVVGLSSRLFRAQPVLKPLSELGYSLLPEPYLAALDRTIIRRVRRAVATRLWRAAAHLGASALIHARVQVVRRRDEGGT